MKLNQRQPGLHGEDLFKKMKQNNFKTTIVLFFNFYFSNSICFF